MHNRMFLYHARAFAWRHLWHEELLALLLVLFVFISPASAAMRFQERSVYINSSVPGATTYYELSWRYMSTDAVGSVDMLFCIDPIPHHECVTPPGLDVSGAVLVEQDGETGFSIASQTANHIVLTRSPTAISTAKSTYKFDNIVNPDYTGQSFSIRLRSHASLDATGAQIDFGSVKAQIIEGIVVETQVPPILIFCVAEVVSEDCSQTNENYYKDLGELNAQATLSTQSQMAVGTNATGGFVITANGNPMSAGTSIIENLDEPAVSRVGVNQFGINLVANSEPSIGSDPEGPWTNAVTTPDYSMPNMYKYVSGEAVAYAPNVSLMRKFTVSYIINSKPDLKPGVYSTTVSYVASGRF